MKKNLLIIALFAVTLFVTVNCSKNKDAKDCTELAAKVDAAYYTSTVNPTVANCQAYKTAINNFLKCPAITATQKSTFQLLLSQLTC